jgi:hypothetical protein
METSIESEWSENTQELVDSYREYILTTIIIIIHCLY